MLVVGSEWVAFASNAQKLTNWWLVIKNRGSPCPEYSLRWGERKPDKTYPVEEWGHQAIQTKTRSRVHSL